MTSIAVAPVIAPEDRSNSPPIISSETATAMMPELGRHVEVVGRAGRGAEHVGASAQKKNQTAVVPIEGADLRAHQQPLDRPRWSEPLVRLRRRSAAPIWRCVQLGHYDVSHVRSPTRSSGAGGPAALRARSQCMTSGQRVPASTSALTSATFSASTKPGPVRMGRPPPAVLRLVAWRYMSTTGR